MSLNPQQLEAVNSDSSRILCLAGAGTGKTHCMISRIIRLVDDGVDPSSMLVLTFTNAAAFEMKQRYTRLCTSSYSPEFRTFHSFCYYILCSNKAIRQKVGYDSVPQICDEAQFKKVNQSVSVQLNINISKSKLSGKQPMSPKETEQAKLFIKAVRRQMIKLNLITFDDLCYEVCKLFEDNDPSIQTYKLRFKYIFVDEFQDTDPKQYQFVKSFQDSNVFLVGDALQAIYSFRGADSSIIKAISEDSNWTTFKLTKNYRSTKEICEFANARTGYAEDSYRILIHSDSPGDRVDVFYYDKFDIVKYIKMNRIEGKTAVLSRTNAEVDDICKTFDEYGIGYSRNSSKDDSVCILRCSLDNEYMLNYLPTKLSSDEYSEYLRLSYRGEDDNPYTVKQLLEDFKSNSVIESIVSKVRQIRNISHRNVPPISKIASILDILDMKGTVVDESVVSLSTLLEFIANYKNQTDDSIYVGTIHSSKGLEYDRVLLVGVDGDHFKLNSEENRNLYYVGITRAKSNLIVILGEGDDNIWT